MLNPRSIGLSSAVVQECRGLILEEGTWAVACWPFAKFFNAEEPNAAAVVRSFAFDGAKVFEECEP